MDLVLFVRQISWLFGVFAHFARKRMKLKSMQKHLMMEWSFVLKECLCKMLFQLLRLANEKWFLPAFVMNVGTTYDICHCGWEVRRHPCKMEYGVASTSGGYLFNKPYRGKIKWSRFQENMYHQSRIGQASIYLSYVSISLLNVASHMRLSRLGRQVVIVQLIVSLLVEIGEWNVEAQSPQAHQLSDKLMSL